MASNIIQLSFNGETSVVSEELVYKYDYGQQIEFTDLTLPEYFEVHFSNNKTGKATKQIGHNGVVDIPDRYLEIGSVYGWIFLHNTDSDGETEYEFKIPVKNRAMPSDGEVTPEQESAISQAIAALTSTQASVQALHDETEGYRDDASASSSYAHDAQTAAESAQDAAEMAETSAGFSKIAAEAAQSAAEIAQGKAEDAQTAAESAQAAAEAARDDVLGMSAEAETLPAGSSATASYADGVLSLGIPRGDKGETGDTGATGETGNGIASVVKTSTSGLVDTYTITYTDGTTSTFEVTNGKDGEDSDVQDVQIDGTSILSDGVANIPTADTYYTSRYGVVKLADVVESGDNYNTIQLKYTRQGSAKSKTLATSAVATTSKRGLMSKDDKAKLDGIASGAEANVQSDWNQTNTSADDYIKNKPTLADVAMSGSYNDLEDTPTKVSDLENDAGYVDAEGTVAMAEQLDTDKCSVDTEPYHFRASSHNNADRQLDTIVGGSVAWNQIFDSTGLATSTESGVTYTKVSNYEWNISGNATAQNTKSIMVASKLTANHVYCVANFNSFNGQLRYRFGALYYSADAIAKWSGTQNLILIHTPSASFSNATLKLMVIDLTQLLGSTIADYVYSLEQSTSGSGVAWLKRYFDLDSYHPYDSGSIQSVSGLSAHVVRDADDNIVGNYPLDNTLTLRGIPKLSDGSLYYDGDTYESDGTVTRKYGIVDLGSLTWTKEVASSGHPNWATFYAAPPNAKGMFSTYGTTQVCSKYAQGTSQGTASDQWVDKTCRFGLTSKNINIADSSLSDLDATAFKTAMSGAYLVYELATPTTETATPYTNPQLSYDGGTEEYVSDCIVPIGHETKYPENLKAKIEGLPWDFSSIIAPTEKTNIASRNYTAGSLLIMGNVLYKVTSNIANGGTITPNTNCTATTLSEVISALA